MCMFTVAGGSHFCTCTHIHKQPHTPCLPSFHHSNANRVRARGSSWGTPGADVATTLTPAVRGAPVGGTTLMPHSVGHTTVDASGLWRQTVPTTAGGFTEYTISSVSGGQVLNLTGVMFGNVIMCRCGINPPWPQQSRAPLSNFACVFHLHYTITSLSLILMASLPIKNMPFAFFTRKDKSQACNFSHVWPPDLTCSLPKRPSVDRATSTQSRCKTR